MITAETCRDIAGFITDEILNYVENGWDYGQIGLSKITEGPDVLNFNICEAGGEKTLFLNLTKGSNVIHGKGRAACGDAGDIRRAVMSVLGFGEIFASGVTAEKAVQIQKVLADNGVDPDETATVAQAIGYVLGEEWESVLDWNR